MRHIMGFCLKICENVLKGKTELREERSCIPNDS